MPDGAVVLVPGLPLLAALANGVLALLPVRYPSKLSERLVWGSILLSFAGSLWVLVETLLDPTQREVAVYRWLFSGGLDVDFAFLIDPLAAVMMVVVTGISFLIAVFSVNYMHNERGVARYFTVTPLFVAAMLVLVMADNYVLLFLGWEAVGVCSYLLISFYSERRAAAAAATKAFCMNRIGDAGFLLGIFLIVNTFGTADYVDVFARADAIGTGTATAIGLLLLVGAIGKSAQLPLATWLPRAMEGPTPSSALIHAATMVTAGVYLIARSHEVYAQAPDALLAVAVVGATTAAFGAVVGLVQTDIKSLLAYSTTAQLGLMFLACGLGAYAIAIFHFAAHAVFKTFLFLTAPSILHHLHPATAGHAAERRRAPVASTLFLVGAAGLVAFPFLSGWWQADVLGAAYAHGAYILLGVGALAAFSAAFTTRRLVHEVFAPETHGEPTARGAMRLPAPLGVLAALTAIGLLLGVLPGGLEGTWFERFLEPVVAAAPGVPAGTPVLQAVLMTALILFVVAGWVTPVYLDRHRRERAAASPLTRSLYNAAFHRLWLDELYGRAVTRPTMRLAGALDRLDSGVLATAFRAPPPVRPAPRPAPVPTPALAESAGGVHASVAGSIAKWVLASFAATAARVERDVIGRAVGGVATRFLGIGARISGWIETGVVGAAERVVDRGAELSVKVSAAAEQLIFQQGVHIGVPRFGDVLGRALTKIEERLGHPLVVGSILVVWLVVVLLGAAWR